MSLRPVRLLVVNFSGFPDESIYLKNGDTGTYIQNDDEKWNKNDKIDLCARET